MNYSFTNSAGTLLIRFFLTFLVLLTVGFAINGQSQLQVKEEIKQQNENCLKCHGQSKYKYLNPESGLEVTKRMYTETIIKRSEFYVSNHRTFKCIDCHSEDYDTFPHPGRLRMETRYACIDCHGTSEADEKFNFETIESEFHASIHSTKHSDDFNCWMCHNPHTYKINLRSKEKIKDIVEYDNAICLNCHADVTKYQMLTDKVNPNILTKHEWLPNQGLHFKAVRCIECHARPNDAILVAHNVQPKNKAVKRCVECHSTNSILMASLYKYKVKEQRSESGFFNSVIMNEGYMIGANRNYYLGVLSIAMFLVVLAGIAIHGTLRIVKKAK
jgi:nitrate reductase cytochrome c-type subunit